MNQNLPSRVMLIDIIRGFALLGIILVRASYAYSGNHLDPGHEPGLADKALNAGVELFLKNKFYTIFSFLFGIGFAIQIQSAARKQQPFTERFLWRLFLLFVIGYLHSLIYHSDILQRYAVLGLLLIPLRNLRDTYIWMISIAFFLLASMNIYLSADLAVYLSDLKDPGGFVRNELTSHVVKGRLGMIAGLFVLGLYAGRKQIFLSNASNRRLFRNILLLSAATGVLATVALYSGWSGHFLFPYAKTLLLLIQIIAVSAFYVAGVAMLYLNTRLAGILSWLSPVGRMALTNYLLQSVFFVALPVNLQGLFPGLGGMLGISVLFFLLQVVFSRYWAARFRFGPVEWLWRYTTDRMSILHRRLTGSRHKPTVS